MNSLYMDNDTKEKAWRINTAAIYNHKFKKAGRAFAISAGYNRSEGENKEELLSENTFYQLIPYTTWIQQMNNINNDKEQVKSSVLYSEPLSKIFFLETFYNFNITTTWANNQAHDPRLDNARVDSLSLYYSNQSLVHRIGTGLRYADNGLNIMLGVAGQRLSMEGRYSIDKGEPLLTNPLDKIYLNLSPKFSISYEMPNGMYLDGDYGYGLEEPSFSDLQPTPIVTNPAIRVYGNPNLKPERSHRVNAGLYYNNPRTFASVNVGVDYRWILNNISYNRTIDWVDSIGYVTTIRPDNTTKGNNGNLWVWSEIPLVKTKLTLDLYGSVYNDQSGAYVNDALNKTSSQQYQFSTGLKITPGQKLIIDLSGSLSFRDVHYSINKEQNQQIYSYGADMSIKWQFLKKTFFESNFTYNLYNNESYDFSQSMPILNASVRQLIGKQNRFQIRLAAFDIFDKNFDISEFGYYNYVQRSMSPTLARYFMLSVSYNLKGFENKLKKDRFW